MERFFEGYREAFGRLNQKQVNGFNFLVPQLLADDRLNIYYRAYILATIKHETAHTMQPIKELASDAWAERRYGHFTRVGKKLGNINPGDGYIYKGRGYVQITGRANYIKMSAVTGVDLLNQPDLALEPAIAYQIMIHGMLNGTFTGKSLSDYLRKEPKYSQARRIINGTDRALQIARIAINFEKILRDLDDEA